MQASKKKKVIAAIVSAIAAITLILTPLAVSAEEGTAYQYADINGLTYDSVSHVLDARDWDYNDNATNIINGIYIDGARSFISFPLEDYDSGYSYFRITIYTDGQSGSYNYEFPLIPCAYAQSARPINAQIYAINENARIRYQVSSGQELYLKLESVPDSNFANLKVTIEVMHNPIYYSEAEINARVIQLQTSIGKLEQEINENRILIRNLRQDGYAYELEIAQLEDSISEKQEEIASLNSQKAYLTRLLEEANSSNEAFGSLFNGFWQGFLNVWEAFMQVNVFGIPFETIWFCLMGVVAIFIITKIVGMFI